MISFQVDDMSCGHCVSSITKALQVVDAQARLNIDLPAHRVNIEPAAASAETLRQAIVDAGFTPVAVAAG